MARTLTAKDGRRYRATSTPGVVIAGDPPSLDLRTLDADGEVCLLPGIALDSSRNTFRRVRDAEEVAKRLRGMEDWTTYSGSKYVRPDADEPDGEDEDGWKPVFVPEFYNLADKVQDAFPRPMSRHARYWMTPCPAHGLEYIAANRRCEPPYWAPDPDHESNETGEQAMADTANYGIANTGPGSMTFADSPITYGGKSEPVAPRKIGPEAAPAGDMEPASPITNTGSGTVTVEGKRLAFGPGRGQGTSRWADAPAGGGRPGGVAEFEDLASVQRFAQQVVALGEGSDFVQVIKGCGALHEMIRDFGGDMNRDVREFVEAAIRVEKDGIALRDQAAQVAGLANDLSGG